eukprot:scaffold381_cov178-Amphora_coffeaeformis.AAC.25
MSDVSFGKSVTLTVVPAITGLLSILGSSTVLGMIARYEWKDPTASRCLMRLLIGLCIADLINSAVWTTWPLWIPRGTPGIWLAVGNKATCDAQGFLQQMSGTAGLYSGALSHYYMAFITKNISDREYGRRYEWKWHLFCNLYPLVTAALGLVMDSYVFTDLGCWYGTEPYYCWWNDDIPCTRAEWGVLLGWITLGIPHIVLLFWISYCMYTIYSHVRGTVLNQDSYNFRLRSIKATEQAAGGSAPNTRIVVYKSNSPSVENAKPVQATRLSAVSALTDGEEGGEGSEEDEDEEAGEAKRGENYEHNAFENEKAAPNASGETVPGDSSSQAEGPPVGFSQRKHHLEKAPDESSSLSKLPPVTLPQEQHAEEAPGDSSPSKRPSVSFHRDRSADRDEPSGSYDIPSIGNTSTTRRSRASGRKDRSNATLREVALQSALYPTAYFGTHLWSFVCYIFYMAKYPSWFGMFLLGCTWPLQGFLNMFIYLRPRMKQIKSRNPEWSSIHAFYQVVVYGRRR